MGRLVFSGLMDKYPDLTILTHHCGGLVPYEANRISAGLDLARAGFGRSPSRSLARTRSNTTKRCMATPQLAATPPL